MSRWSDRIEGLVARLAPPWFWEKWYRLGMRVANRRGDKFVTHHTRPKFARDVGTWSDPVRTTPRFAVAMQGPVAADGFTLETLRIYDRHMPDARLVLSTWEDTDPKLLDPVRAAGVDVVLSAKPTDPGNLNVNYQIVSAGAGVRRAAELGAEWVLKTRTDQRLYAPNLPEFLVGLTQAFPVAGGFRQKYRVVGVGADTWKFGLYKLTDQTVFGHAEDMATYWSPSLRPKGVPPGWRDVIGEACRHFSPESYLASEFLARVGREVRWTLEDSWAAFADHFCIADLAATDFFWPKYLKSLEYDRRYDAVDSSQELTFREWLILYAARANKPVLPEHERALEVTLRVPLDPPPGLPAPGG